MHEEKEFLKRRIEEALFHYWLMNHYGEKNGDSLSISLADEYRKKYLRLMNRYIELFKEETDL